MRIPAFVFWICWSVELIAFLVIGFDLWQRYAQRAIIPIAPDQWKSGMSYLIILSILLSSSSVLRFIGQVQWAGYVVVAPVALLLAFFLLAAVAILLGVRIN